MSGKANTDRRGRTRRPAREPALTDLDLRILDLVCAQRVLTSAQLAALAPGTSARTLRYRCNRLSKHGLLGRSRPYRERGSAPHHLWPTRRGEALACGGPPPRGGERREPNPLFLAHAAGLSEIYVALETTLPDGFKLTRFEREADAREPFVTWPGQDKRAIAPDAFIEIADADGRELCAFVELDRGTMTHRQLKRKAAGYAEYDKAGAWRERHRFCPALLFITTTEKRARSFLAAMRRQCEREPALYTCACDLARELKHCATEPRWLFDDRDERGFGLLPVLREARRPYDEELARAEAEQREKEDERERLRTDPEALRVHLRSLKEESRMAEHTGHPVIGALAVTVEREGELEQVEREALLAFAGMLAEPLSLQSAGREPTDKERRALDALVEYHRAAQRRRAEDLARRFGEGPTLRNVRPRIAKGELLGERELDRLSAGAERDCESHRAQRRLRNEYLGWREREARRLAKAQSLFGRLRHGPQTFLDQIDRRALRLCRGCEEIAYPDPERADAHAKRHVAGRCHYCGAGALAEFGPSPEEEDKGQWA